MSKAQKSIDVLGSLVRALVGMREADLPIVLSVVQRLAKEATSLNPTVRKRLAVFLRDKPLSMELYTPLCQRHGVATGEQVLEELKNTGRLDRCVTVVDLQIYVDYPGLIPYYFRGKDIMAWGSVYSDGDDVCVHFLHCDDQGASLQRKPIRMTFGNTEQALLKKEEKK